MCYAAISSEGDGGQECFAFEVVLCSKSGAPALGIERPDRMLLFGGWLCEVEAARFGIWEITDATHFDDYACID